MKNKTNLIINILVILAMTFFAIPKLLGKPQSIEGFKQFEAAIHIDADLFRIFTGVSELAIVALVLLYALSHDKIIGTMAFGFLLVTMISALGLEFFARPEPKILLVIIAVFLSIMAAYQLKKLTQHKTLII